MTPESKIYVAGHRGLAGSAIVRRLKAKGYRSIVVQNHADLELRDPVAVQRFFDVEKPNVVFLAAAKVGGILANHTYPADFIRDNLLIQTNVIDAAWRNGVKDLLFLGSSCIYPRDCRQPIKESDFLTGPLERTNRPYAIAKIAGIEMCWSYNRQHGTRYLCAMPTNLYGPGDNYDLRTSHVLPALIRKFHEAKIRNERTAVVWGSGKPRREFLYSDDMADACIHLMQLKDAYLTNALPSDHPPLINVGTGKDLTIAQLAKLVADIVESRVEIAYDASKPDGTPQKVLDTGLINSLGWRPSIRLADGIKRAYDAFLEALNLDSEAAKGSITVR